MMNFLANLTKAATAVVAAPVAVVADILTLPASSLDPHRSPFGKTEHCLQRAAECFDAAVKPESQA